jgi:DNA-binding transcriptional LysR family regulator
MFATLPVTALRTFEAAARLRSFKLAAAELSVTATAVSHQVKALERHVGAALFERVPRGVRLTDAGALLDVAQALDALRPAPAAGALTLSTTHSFAALWLVPRLGRFYEAHPQYQLRLDASAESVDLLQDASVDVAVRYSRRRFPDLHTACRLQEWFGVYGAPALVARQGRRAPALVTVRWRDSPLYEQGWQDWCEAAGLPAWRRPATVHAYTEEHYALQAAIAGQGLVLASSAMVSDSVAAGTLAAYRPEVRVQGAAYTALCAPGRERHPPVKAFLAWLREEFKN